MIFLGFTFYFGKSQKGYPIAKLKTSKKRYKDKQTGEFKNSNSYDINDLPKVVAVMNKAFDYLTSREAEEAQ